MLREFATDLWIAEQPFRFLAMEVGLRMSVIRLRDGGLFVHSPVHLDQATREALDALGGVRFVVAPNRFHHLFVADYVQGFPQAAFHCAPGLEKKRMDLKFTSVLSDTAPPGWAGQLEQLVFTAFKPLNEVVFFHRASRTLLLADLLFNVPSGAGSLSSRLLLWLDGCNGRAAVPRTFRLLLKFRRASVRGLMDCILSWDFDRIVLAHGAVIGTDAKRALARAWSFL